MTVRPLLLGLLCAALALGTLGLGAGVPPATADVAHYSTPVKIMLGGDSITQGFDGDYTWRYRLDRELRRQHVPFDFVGPRKYTYGGAYHYAVGSGWDMDHDATGGTRLRTQLSEIVKDMANYTPDVLVELYGTTDLLPRPPSDPNQAVPLNEEIADLRSYISKAREVNANVDIVLGEVTTRRIPNRQAFNDALGALAKEQDRPASFDNYYPDSRVVVADLDYPGWDPTTYTYDTTHPTPAGEAVIAQRVAWALRAVGLLPGSPKISSAGLIWSPPWAPRIYVSRTRRIVVDWSTSKFLNKPQMLRARVNNLRTHRIGVTGWLTSPQYISGVLRPGRYAVQVQGRRQAMISPWSKIWTTTVGR